jgi:hypothetical protein
MILLTAICFGVHITYCWRNIKYLERILEGSRKQLNSSYSYSEGEKIEASLLSQQTLLDGFTHTGYCPFGIPVPYFSWPLPANVCEELSIVRQDIEEKVRSLGIGNSMRINLRVVLYVIDSTGYNASSNTFTH